MITFRYPWLLLLLVLLIPIVWWYISRLRTGSPSIGMSSLRAFRHTGRSWKEWLMHICFALQVIALGCVIVAIARPQTENSKSTSQIEGTDIVLALDISGSMSANDIAPNRFEAAKQTAADFVKGRTNDNIGLVAFSGTSLSLMPLTYDRVALVNAIGNIRMGELDNGTAIGDGLASAINRLAQGKAKSKSIILLTDGTNNAGEVAPSTAADIARDKGIRVYTIGVGTDQAVEITDPYGFTSTTMDTKIDEDALKEIADVTGGKYFRARDSHTLQRVFSEIDSLEKSRLDVNRYVRMDEGFLPWLIAALVCLGFVYLMRYTVLRRIP